MLIRTTAHPLHYVTLEWPLIPVSKKNPSVKSPTVPLTIFSGRVYLRESFFGGSFPKCFHKNEFCNIIASICGKYSTSNWYSHNDNSSHSHRSSYCLMREIMGIIQSHTFYKSPDSWLSKLVDGSTSTGQDNTDITVNCRYTTKHI